MSRSSKSANFSFRTWCSNYRNLLLHLAGFVPLMDIFAALTGTHFCNFLLPHAIKTLLILVLVNKLLIVNVGLFILFKSSLMKIKRLTITKFTSNRFFELSRPVKLYFIFCLVFLLLILINI